MTRGSGAVTIGMPVHNGEPWLATALDSVLAQTYGDLVVHVADNASTDATEEICRDAAGQNDRIVYDRHDRDIGAVANFNHVAAAARTPFFKWAAADDLIAPTFVERCVAALAARPEAVLAHPRTRAIDEDGRDAVVSLVPGPGLTRVDYLEYTNTDGPWSVGDDDPVVRFRRVMRDLWYTVQLYGVMRTEVLQATALHPFHYMGDHILLSELVLHGPFEEVDDVLFRRRVHSGQASAKAEHAERIGVAARDREATAGRTTVASQYPERMRLHLAGVRRAPLSVAQQLACARVLAGTIARWARQRVAGTAVEPLTGPAASAEDGPQ